MLSGKLAASRTLVGVWVLSGFALFAGAAGAQTTTPTRTSTAAPAAGSIDEITVRGSRSLAVVQDEAARATEAFYLKLNDVIDDKEYEIHCEWESGGESVIRKRVCRTGWQEDLLAEVGRAAYDERAFDPTSIYYEKQRNFTAKLLTAINGDPDLVKAVRHLLALQDEVSALNGSRSSRSVP